MNKILIVEDSEMVVRILRHLIQNTLTCEIVHAATLAQAQSLYNEHQGDFFAALIDLHLGDAPNGEIVDFTLGKKIPTIVLTASYEEQRREQLFSKGIVDYVTKDGRYSYEKAVNMIQRLEKNQRIQVLVVDDSDMSRKHVINLLKRHLFQVYEAIDGVEAIKVLLDNPGISLLITDYNMPRMDGFELVKNVRFKYDKTDLIMIGISGDSNEALSAKFIKHGANDFLRKPFHPEEFYCRIIHNIESLELIQQLERTADRDYLTDLHNRSYFFKAAQELLNASVEKSTPIATVVLNIDEFREVNNRFGSEGGDLLLQYLASALQKMLGRFILCRANADEFYAVISGLDNDKVVSLVSKVRQLVAEDPMTLNNELIYCHFSAGVTNKKFDRVEDCLEHAIKFLKLAKESGGNMAVGDDEENNGE